METVSQPVVTSLRPVQVPTAGLGLHHVLVVGGTLEEWVALTPADWKARVVRLGQYCDQLGVPWLTIRVYGPAVEPAVDGVARSTAMGSYRTAVGGCSVLVDPHGDGRRRFAEAMQRIPADVAVSEASVADALYAPADAEPDLVVVLGSPTQLPPSLVWELAYAELVFLPVAWEALSAEHLAAAAEEFARRRRRFGGLDPD
jgi:undecaprenyl diphosphate synthase